MMSFNEKRTSKPLVSSNFCADKAASSPAARVSKTLVLLQRSLWMQYSTQNGVDC